MIEAIKVKTNSEVTVEPDCLDAAEKRPEKRQRSKAAHLSKPREKVLYNQLDCRSVIGSP